MASNFWTAFNWIFLAIITAIAIWSVWGYLPNDSIDDIEDVSVDSQPDACVDIESLDGISFDACFDAYSTTIFLKIARERANYNIKGFDISFVDLFSKSDYLDIVPGEGQTKAYKITAKKNPNTLNIRSDVVRDFSGSSCGQKSVFVDFCPVGTSGGVNVSISPLDGVGFTDYIEVEDLNELDSDIIVVDLVERERIWSSSCRSEWECGEWGECVDGVERRDCRDTEGCAVSTDSPSSVRSCDGACIEKWECEWSSCSGGVSVPTCFDVNGCGTSFSEPGELSCGTSSGCVPDVVCSEWSECLVDYNFMDLVGSPNEIVKIAGSRNRLCVDKEGCAENVKEEESCSVSVDIYAKTFKRCGENYVGVYDVLTDEVLAILKEGEGRSSYLNIYFDDIEDVYCDYCFDGVLNGDEEDVDCGGSCKECRKEVVQMRSWWELLF